MSGFNDLLPCPFCGSEAYETCQSGRYGLFGFIECDDCGARSKAYGPLDKPEMFENKEDFWKQTNFVRAARRWNRRKE